ncbi:hypothetical protein [Novosphingobium sp.]|uniref:hypothetical protein n=1 Tax=Novosphingobium sp. TaxID=1874826 RepID=UPI0025E1BD52|nr:hypothetical protein [Novosphingobium sp.]
MSGGTRIVAIDGSASGLASDDVLELTMQAEETAVSAAADPHEEQWWEDDQPKRPSRLRAPAIAVALLLAGWTAFFAFANWPAIVASPAPNVWAAWIGQWAMPVVLILLLAHRIGAAKAPRPAAFDAELARDLAVQSAQLQDRMVTMNGELSIAREFIAAQSRDLEALGRMAVERLEASAGKLGALVTSNGENLDRIATVSTAALDNMEKLRGQMPVVANSAKDVTNLIANAGRTAHLQLEDMVSGFQRLNEFGQASTSQIEALREIVSGALANFNSEAEDMGRISTERFAALDEAHAATREAFDGHEADVLEAMRNRAEKLSADLAAHRAALEAAEAKSIAAHGERIGALTRESRAVRDAITNDANSLASLAGERHATLTALAEQHRIVVEEQLAAMDRALGQRHATLASIEIEAADALERRVAAFEVSIDSMRKAQRDHAAALAAECDSVNERVAAFSTAIRETGEDGRKGAERIDEALSALNARLEDSRKVFVGTDVEISRLTDGAVRVLELIRAASEHTAKDIPEAVRTAEQSLAGIEGRVDTLGRNLGMAGDTGRALSGHVEDSRAGLVAAQSELDALHDALRDHTAQSAALSTELVKGLAEARTESAALLDETDAKLTPAFVRLTDAARSSGEAMRDAADREIDGVSERLGEATSAAVVKVMQGRAAELISRLEQAIDRATDASRESTIAMRDQLSKVDELAGNLESRVARARERALEQVDNDFARRAALITESLNSNAIDIAKALSTDVSETAWASYLRGDRGIFTRRAVSLLEGGEARSIQQLYEAEPEFREHVNRYVHDFEAMLRQMLSTRDGNSLGVTLLSSDMGKLYVALAQGIERLRA